MKSYPSVRVVVRREHRPEWGKHCCIYLIHYLDGWLYVGRLVETKKQKLGYPYVGQGHVLESFDLKLQEFCTHRDLPYHASQIDYIEQWYCDPRFHSKLESWFIRRCAAHYGISPRVLDFFEPNPFTKQFVSQGGLLLNVTDNGFQQGKTASSLEAHLEGSRSGGRKAAAKRDQIFKDTGFYGSEDYRNVCSKGASIANLNFTEDQRHKMTRKSADTKKALNLHPTRQPIGAEYPSTGSWIIKSGLKPICQYLESAVGSHFSYTSLQKSLKRNYGDTVYKGIHFKYASLLTEDELKSATTL